jgi:hypothetical protein
MGPPGRLDIRHKIVMKVVGLPGSSAIEARRRGDQKEGLVAILEVIDAIRNKIIRYVWSETNWIAHDLLCLT